MSKQECQNFFSWRWFLLLLFLFVFAVLIFKDDGFPSAFWVGISMTVNLYSIYYQASSPKKGGTQGPELG